MIVYVVTFALTGLTAFVVGCFVLRNSPQAQVNRSWFLLSFAVGVYCTFFCFHIMADSSESAVLYAKLLHIGSVLASPLFFLFAAHLVKLYDRVKYFIIFSFFLAPVFAYLLTTQTLIAGAEPHDIYKFFIVLGPLYKFYIWYFAINVIVGHACLLYGVYRSRGVHKVRIQYQFMASFVGFFGASSTFLTAYGVKGVELLSMMMPMYPLIVGYAIVKHQLMDIEFVIKRATVFAGVFAAVYGVFAFFTFLSQGVFETAFHSNPWIAIIPTLLVITFGLRPLENLLTNLTEKFLFQKKYDYRVLLRMFTTEVLSILDINQLPQKTVFGLNTIIKLESCAFMLRNKTTGIYEFKAGYGIKIKDITMKPDDPLPYYLNGSRDAVIRGSNAKVIDDKGDIRADFDKLSAELCLPIVFQDEMLGFISLGMKKSGEDYIQEDIDVLMSLARTEGIAITNARLLVELTETQAEAAQKEKMAVIGTLASGINHEICNPLGIARGHCEMFLLNQRDGIYKNKSDKELIEQLTTILNKVIKEVDRATSITKRLSSFAKPTKKLVLESVNVRSQVDGVFEILGHELSLENIQLGNEIADDVPNICADRHYVQEVMFNIVRNAAQAIPGKGSIVIRASKRDDLVDIDIQDSGSGIPQERINEIFNPFFTTKEPGKGTGLGLFIVKQVVERNGGKISVSSDPGKGTTFTLTFKIWDEAKMKKKAAVEAKKK